MSSDHNSSPHGSRRHLGISDREMAATPIHPVEPYKSLAPMSVAGAQQPILPLPNHSPADHTEAIHHRSDYTRPQYSSSQRSHYTTQQRPATQPQASSPLNTPHQYRPAIFPTLGLTSLPHGPSSGYLRGSINEISQRSGNEYSSSHSISTQNAHRGNSLHSLDGAVKFGSYSPLRDSSESQRSSITSLGTHESIHSQYRQSAANISQSQYNVQDM